MAASVFLESGFQAASMNEIARRTGVTKQTFYARFPTKEELFLAVIDRRMLQMTDQFATLLNEALPLRQVLLNLAHNYYRAVLAEDHLALLRVVYMEAFRFPGICQKFVKLGPGRVSARLTDFLLGQMAAGALDTADAKMAAEHFLALVSGPSLQQALLGVPQRLEKKVIETRLTKDVDAFLAIYAREDPQPVQRRK